MAKTYQLKALWSLLPLEVASAPVLATLDAYGGAGHNSPRLEMPVRLSIEKLAP